MINIHQDATYDTSFYHIHVCILSHIHVHLSHLRILLYLFSIISPHIYIYTYMHTYIHAYIHTDRHTDIQTDIQTYIHTYRPTHTQTHTHAHIHAYTHTHIHTEVITSVNEIRKEPNKQIPGRQRHQSIK